MTAADFAAFVFSPGAIAFCALGGLLWVTGWILQDDDPEMRRRIEDQRRLYATAILHRGDGE